MAGQADYRNCVTVAVERVPEAGVTVSQAAHIAVAVDSQASASVLSVGITNRESPLRWRDTTSPPFASSLLSYGGPGESGR
jgi:hypothetical protein